MNEPELIKRVEDLERRINELEQAFDSLPGVVNKYGLHVDELEAKYEGHRHYWDFDQTWCKYMMRTDVADRTAPPPPTNNGTRGGSSNGE